MRLYQSTMSALLTKLVNDLSRDASAIVVRVAVFKGLKYLLENPLSLVCMRLNGSTLAHALGGSGHAAATSPRQHP